MSLRAEIHCRRGEFELRMGLECGDEICALVGPNGSGKTTLLDAISGELAIRDGRVQLDDRILEDPSQGIRLPARERGCVRVYQRGRLFPHMDVEANLQFGAAESGGLERDEVVRLLRLGSLMKRRPQELSGGEQQRVALARALLARSRALLLDEALNAVDHGLRRELMDALPHWRARLGVPMLYVSHALDEVERLADRVVRMDDALKL